MDNNDKNKNASSHFKSIETHYDPYENIEIAGMPEHNARVQERRNQQLYQNENALTRQQLQAINDNLQKQIDEQKAEITAGQKANKRTKISGWIQFVISSLIGLGGFIVALIALIISVA